MRANIPVRKETRDWLFLEKIELQKRLKKNLTWDEFFEKMFEKKELD